MHKENKNHLQVNFVIRGLEDQQNKYKENSNAQLKDVKNHTVQKVHLSNIYVWNTLKLIIMIPRSTPLLSTVTLVEGVIDPLYKYKKFIIKIINIEFSRIHYPISFIIVNRDI